MRLSSKAIVIREFPNAKMRRIKGRDFDRFVVVDGEKELTSDPDAAKRLSPTAAWRDARYAVYRASSAA